MTNERRVTGIGGVFFKVHDPNHLAAWYREHLGIPVGPDPQQDSEPAERSAMFQWREMDDPDKTGMTVWALFPQNTSYFSPGDAPYMVNYRVADLDVVLEALRAEGVWIDERREEHEYGRFAWIKDPEGNRIELWQPLGG